MNDLRLLVGVASSELLLKLSIKAVLDGILRQSGHPFTAFRVNCTEGGLENGGVTE